MKGSENVKEKLAVKGIIFDLDGVIVFTDKFHYEAWKWVADRSGIYFDKTVNNRLRGVSRTESLEIILESYKGKPLTEAEKKKMAEEKNEYYCHLLQKMSPSDVAMEVRSTLAELRRRGYRMAIGSSSKNAKLILEKTGLLRSFDAVSDGTNIVQSKPDPEVFIKAAEYLKIAQNECAVVEDARAGIDAAKAGDMTAIAIGDAVNYERADIYLSNFTELLHILL